MNITLSSRLLLPCIRCQIIIQIFSNWNMWQIIRPIPLEPNLQQEGSASNMYAYLPDSLSAKKNK